MLIVSDEGVLFEHKMELTSNYKLKFIPPGKYIKNAIKEKLEQNEEDRDNRN